MEFIIKRILYKCMRVISRPLYRMIFGLLLAVLPLLIGAEVSIADFEPGFNYGVFYGVGMMILIRAGFDFFSKK